MIISICCGVGEYTGRAGFEGGLWISGAKNSVSLFPAPHPPITVRVSDKI